jgi:hypothetical protein
MNTCISPFTPRPVLHISRLTKSQLKQLERRLHFSFPLSPRHPPNMSNPRCARIRIWWSDVCGRCRQLAHIKTLKQDVQARIAEAESTITLFHNAARLHRIDVCTHRDQTALKRPHSPTASSISSTSSYASSIRYSKKRKKQE